MDRWHQLRLVHGECDVHRAMGRGEQRARRAKAWASGKEPAVCWQGQEASRGGAVGGTGFVRRSTGNRSPPPPPAGCPGAKARGTCPLLLDGVDVGLGEPPAIRQLPPLEGPQVPGGQAPQRGAERLRLLPVVLLEGHALPREVTGVPEGQVVLWADARRATGISGGIPARPSLVIPGRDLGTGVAATGGFLAATLVSLRLDGLPGPLGPSCSHGSSVPESFLTSLSLRLLATVKRPPQCHLSQEGSPMPLFSAFPWCSWQEGDSAVVANTKQGAGLATCQQAVKLEVTESSLREASDKVRGYKGSHNSTHQPTEASVSPSEGSGRRVPAVEKLLVRKVPPVSACCFPVSRVWPVACEGRAGERGSHPGGKKPFLRAGFSGASSCIGPSGSFRDY